MKKKVKTVCQIIRFRGKIEAFLVLIDLFDIPSMYKYLLQILQEIFSCPKLLQF